MAKKKVPEVFKTPLDLRSSLLFIHRRRVQKYLDKRTDSRAELAAICSREGFIFELPVRFDELISAEFCGRTASRIDKKFKEYFSLAQDGTGFCFDFEGYILYLGTEREWLLSRVNEEIRKIWSGNTKDHFTKIENDSWMHFAIDIIPEMVKDLKKLSQDYLCQLEES